MQSFLILVILVISFPTLSAHDFSHRIPTNNTFSINLHEEIDLKEHWSEIKEAIKENRKKIFFPTPYDAHAECGRLKGYQTTYLCIFNFRIFMNLALNRIGHFIDNGNELLDHEQHLFNPSNLSSGGHNLNATKLRRFYKEYDPHLNIFPYPYNSHSFRISKRYHEKLQLEEQFREMFIDPLLEKHDDFQLIAVYAGKDTYSIMHHELLHVRFATDILYRTSVLQFWESLTFDEQQTLKSVITTRYNTEDMNIIIDELHAYLLMNDAELHLLGDYLIPFKERLLDFLELKSCHVPPFSI